MIIRQWTTINDAPYFYLETSGTGPTILCLHGRCGRGQSWYKFLTHFGEDYHIIAPDQRGHGYSFKPDSYYTSEEMGEDIIALIKELDLSDIVVLGHSMGGDVAVYLAVTHPEFFKGIGILDKSSFGPDSGAFVTTPSESEKNISNWPTYFPTYGDAIKFLEDLCPSPLSFAYFHDSLVETKDGYTFLFKGSAMDVGRLNFRNMNLFLPLISQPTLLLRAKNGVAVSDSDFNYMQNAIKDVLVREMPDSDHNVHTSDPDLFHVYINEFLEFVEKT